MIFVDIESKLTQKTCNHYEKAVPVYYGAAISVFLRKC
jgi:hypothetical protein